MAEQLGPDHYFDLYASRRATLEHAVGMYLAELNRTGRSSHEYFSRIRDLDNKFKDYGSLGTLYIPDYINIIPDNACMDTHFSEVVLSKNVRKIGDYAFAKCHDLDCVSVDEDCALQDIGDGAFIECRRLNRVTLRDMTELKSIGSGAFRHTDLRFVAIPESVMNIGSSAFAECRSLCEVNMKFCNNLSEISNFMFADCGSLSTVWLPETIDSIGAGAFRDCGSLKSIDLPSSVSIIGKKAFINCTGLMNVDLSMVTSIGDKAFMNNDELSCIRFPDGDWLCGMNAFANCPRIYDIDLGGVIFTDSGAFYNCEGLTSVNMSKMRGYGIPDETFRGCPSINHVTWPELLNMDFFIGKYAFGGIGGGHGAEMKQACVIPAWINIDKTAFDVNAIGDYAEDLFLAQPAFFMKDKNVGSEMVSMKTHADNVSNTFVPQGNECDDYNFEAGF